MPFVYFTCIYKVSFHEGSEYIDAVLSDKLVIIKRTGHIESKSSFYFNHSKKKLRMYQYFRNWSIKETEKARCCALYFSMEK